MMALELYMIGLVAQDMGKSLEFYQRLGLAIPEGSQEQTHVQIKMGSGLTFFLDSNPARWDPSFVKKPASERVATAESYPLVLEFYLKSQAAVEAKYQELTDYGYQGRRAPYKTSFGMCFAMVDDPDGNTILLSGDIE
jgi:uncharacterized glyoxalase superfamily protein PhnB